jgi:glyoxylase I family protein
MATFVRTLHIGLTVRDIDLSARWYQEVLGFRLVKRFDSSTEDVIDRVLLLHPDGGFVIGLYNHADCSGELLSPVRTGFDHVAFEVTDAASLSAWVTRLDEVHLEHSPVRDLGHSEFISFEDPDGIPHEPWHMRTPHHPA